jgi:hypothetical protein
MVILGINPLGMTIESDIVGERRDNETQSGMYSIVMGEVPESQL